MPGWSTGQIQLFYRCERRESLLVLSLFKTNQLLHFFSLLSTVTACPPQGKEQIPSSSFPAGNPSARDVFEALHMELFFIVSGLSVGKIMWIKQLWRASQLSIKRGTMFNKNNLMVNLTLLLLICFLKLNFCGEVAKGVQGFPTCICPLDELNSSLGLQISLLFLMCPTGNAGKLHESFSSAVLIENLHLSHVFCAFKAETHCSLSFFPVARFFGNTLYFLLCSAPHVVIRWKILNNKTAKRICFVLFCL